MNYKKTDREESFEDLLIRLKLCHERVTGNCYNDGVDELVKKIEALENRNEILEKDQVIFEDKICSLEDQMMIKAEENKNLIAALKKAEGAMFGACDKSLTVPEDIKEYKNSSEYKKISHLMEGGNE